MRLKKKSNKKEDDLTKVDYTKTHDLDQDQDILL